MKSFSSRRPKIEKIKLLLVDDHAVLRDGIRALLGACDDIEIIGEASEGQDAIEKAQELSPDVIIMDIAMPNLDGFEATRKIKKKNPQMKVIILTQHDNKEYVISTIKAGATGFVPKRALGSDLVTAIRTVHKGGSFLYPSATSALIKDYLNHVEEDSIDRLTDREREVLRLIVNGHTSREIAETLYISLKTVLGHRAKLMGKLGVHNSTELIKYALRNRLVSLDT